jgi:nucleotide-binding universal stress UspA family protein
MYMGMDGIYAVDLDIPDLKEGLQKRLEAFAAEQFPRMPVTSAVEYGDPAKMIVDYAEEHCFDIIMMPTHGYGSFRRLLLGSITAKVLHDTPVPVWTDAHAPEPSHRAHPKPRHIVCGIDLKADSGRVLDFALKTAAASGATVEVVHGVPEDFPARESGSRQDALEHYNQIQDLLQEAAKQEHVDLRKVHETEVHTVLAGGDIAKLVREVALRKRADLVVIGRGRIQEALGGLRAHAYSIVRESPCPVISV